MIISGTSILISIIFLILSIIHFYWAFGGKWGFGSAIPTNENGQRVLHPRKADSVIVGLGLALFGTFYLSKINVITMALPEWLDTFIGWAIPLIFLARSVGDFKYIGFFKKLKSTKFARQDYWFYSPLCLLLGAIGIIIEYHG